MSLQTAGSNPLGENSPRPASWKTVAIDAEGQLRLLMDYLYLSHYQFRAHRAPVLFKGGDGGKQQERLARDQMAQSERHFAAQQELAAAQLELANKPIPTPPPTPPPVTEVTADTAQAEDARRRQLAKKSGQRNVVGGGVASALGKAQTSPMAAA